jgi:hypothetical protein
MKQVGERSVKTHPLLLERARRLKAREIQLQKDKEYLYESEGLRRDVQRTLRSNPKLVRYFFDHFPDPFARLGQVSKFLEKVSQKKLKRVFYRYVRYVGRFGVTLRIKSGTRRVFQETLCPWGQKFHVAVEPEGFKPAIPNSDVDLPDEYLFECSALKVTKRLQPHIDSGAAKMVEVEDSTWSSALSQLERFAYHPEGITFILHKSAIPYVYCLIGESVSVKVWREMYPVIKELRKSLYGREIAGRPPDLKRQRAIIKSFRESGPDKVKAIDKRSVDTGKNPTPNPTSPIVYYSNLKRKLKTK